MTLLPDYRGGGIVNLTSTLVTALGGDEGLYPGVCGMDGEALRKARNVVLLVIDGLGYEYLARHGEGGLLHRHLAGSLTSVFPSTTATAITTFLTGTAPQQHGLTGWFMHFKEIGGVAAVLPFTWRGGPSLGQAGITAADLFSQRAIFDRIPHASYLIVPKRIANSTFNLAHCGAAKMVPYGSLTQFVAAIAAAVRADRDRKFIYAYWPSLDELGHEYGPTSHPVALQFAQLQSALARLLRQLAATGTWVVVTADHGMIDSGPEWVIELADHPVLADSLVMPLCGERRAAYCYVHPDKVDQFETYAKTVLRDCTLVMRSDDLITGGYFGLGPPHPRLGERVGRYTLIMKGNHVIKDWVTGEKHHVQRGVHGGLSHEEMRVPLILIPPG